MTPDRLDSTRLVTVNRLGVRQQLAYVLARRVKTYGAVNGVKLVFQSVRDGQPRRAV